MFGHPSFLMLTGWKKKSSLKRLFGCISCCFKISLKVSKKEGSTPAFLICTPCPPPAVAGPSLFLRREEPVLEASLTCQQFYCPHLWLGTGFWDWSREKPELGGAPMFSPSPSGYLWIIWDWQERIRREQTHVLLAPSLVTSERPSELPHQWHCFVQKGSQISFSLLDTNSTRQWGVKGCLWPNEAPQEDKGQTLPCMHLKQAEAEALTVMDGAASPRRGARNLLYWAGAGWGWGAANQSTQFRWHVSAAWKVASEYGLS